MNNNNLIYAFDIGITSTGVAVSDGNHIKYMGSHVFNEAKEAKDPRKNRSARRNQKRKNWRKRQLIDAFDDFKIISKTEIKQEGYLSFTAKGNNFSRPIDKTIYHLRKRALTSQVTKRELFLCLYHILHARGHFLLETVDFSKKDPISFNDFKTAFYITTENYFSISEDNKVSFENDILKNIFYNKLNSNDIKALCENAKFTFNNDTDKDALLETIKFICGYKAKIKKINPSFEFEKDTYDITMIKAMEGEGPEFFANIVELNDMIRIFRILKDHNYLCEVAIEKLDNFDRVVKDQKSEEFLTLKKQIENSSKSKSHLRVVRNLENGYPNGLYVKEAREILYTQQKYYPDITNEFIEVCVSIISARIPYYIGPLNENAKNGWVVKNNNFKYSYQYSVDHFNAVDVQESIKKWKERMISHCTYCPEEFALPKGSLIAETVSILNELNVLKAIDSDENEYFLTYKDKVNIINSLFLNGYSVSQNDVAKLLNLKSFGTKKNLEKVRKLNNKYTLYPQIARLIPELKLQTIEEIFSNSKKIDEIEDIILSINLYNEEKSKIEYFEKKGYSPVVAKGLSKLTSKSFFSFSRKFVLTQPFDEYGDSLLTLLFEDNTNKYTNEQMTLISKAVDENGRPIDFSSNKYEKLLKENNGQLDINLLIKNGSPVIPISRPVIRGLNEAMKMYAELLKVYGVPKRVVVETARDLKDHTVVKEQQAFHTDNAKNLYAHLEKQIKENKKYHLTLDVDSWEELKTYEEQNKTKIELYIRQNGRDLLTGEKIILNDLDNYEIDHILPRGFGDDSMDDKMLISKIANAKKGDRLPLEFIESGESINGHVITSSSFIKRVEMLYDMKLISEQKRKRLLLESSLDLEEFINQNLVDTRYIIREFMSILNAYNNYQHYDTHIVSLRAAYTSLYRKAFKFDKVRDYGDQHHAHDAAILIVADKTLSTYYPHYDERKHCDAKLNSYHQFIKDMLSNDKKTQNDLMEFIRYMFYKAYEMSWNSPLSIISEIKDTVPYYSNKVEKNYMGQFFDINSLKQKKDKKSDTSVLSILGINNDKRFFSGVNCVAVDFYKYTYIDKKGKKVKTNVAIQIPKVIVNSKGQIDKEKYLLLIKDFYKANQLLDDKGELISGYFRFRAFKNDIIYNTGSNCPFLFNIGGIANKKLELKYINIFSYNSIYKVGNDIRNKLIKKYNLKTKNNPDGIEFKDINKSVYVDYVNRNYWRIDIDDKRIKRVNKMVENDNNIYELSNHLSYLGLIIERPGTPPSIDGQYTPVVGSSALIGDEDDAQYIKLKYNILGLKFIDNPNGKLIVSSPKEIPGAFKQVKKEPFSWNLCKEDI